MPHKLLHTLVISSALACGCAAAPRPLEPVATLDAVTVEASAPTSEDASAGYATSSGSATPASDDAANSTPANSTSAAPGAALEAMRSCEEGWPTTKGARCEPVEQPDGSTERVCCGSGGSDCCVEPAQ